MCTREFCDCSKVGNFHRWVRGRFNKDHFCVWFASPNNTVHVGRVDKIELEAKLFENHFCDAVGPPIDIVRDDDVITGGEKAKKCIDRCHPGCKRHSFFRIFKCSDILFERCACWI